MARSQNLSLRQKASRMAHIFKAIFKQHHKELIPLFKPYIPENGVVIDVGAHSGQFSKLFASMCPQGHVYAFEPSLYARSILKKVVRLRGLKNINIFAAGLSDEKADKILHIPVKKSGAVGFGLSSLGGNDRHAATIEERVILWRMDDFVKDHALARVDFIKADIEGWEARLLQGATQTIAKFKPTIYLEVDDTMLKRADNTPADIWNLLKPLGYKSHFVEESGKLKACSDYNEIGNYLFSV